MNSNSYVSGFSSPLCFAIYLLVLRSTSRSKAPTFFFSIYFFRFASLSVLFKSRKCVHDVLKIIYFTNCSTWLFFNKYAHQLFFFSFLREYMNQLWEIRHTCTLKQFVRQILKTNHVTCFLSFMVYALQFQIVK